MYIDKKSTKWSSGLTVYTRSVSLISQRLLPGDFMQLACEAASRSTSALADILVLYYCGRVQKYI